MVRNKLRTFLQPESRKIRFDTVSKLLLQLIFDEILFLRSAALGVKSDVLATWGGGGGTSILDLTGCAAQQGVLFR